MKILKFLFLSMAIMLLNQISNAQNVSIGPVGAFPNPKAMLDINATNKGILIPRVKLVNNDNPINGDKPIGLLVWNDSTTYKGQGFYWWNGQNWQAMKYFAGQAIIIDSNNTLSVTQNALNQNGYVPAPGVQHKNSFYQTDKKGNPKWKRVNQTMYYIDKL